MASGSNTNTNVQQPPFPIFDGENYDFWCVKMKTLFLSYDIWEIVEEGYEEPENVETLSNARKQQLKETKRKDAKALHLIQQGVADPIFPRIINATTSNETWDILQKEYRGTLKKFGHLQKDCRRKNNQQANFSEEQESDGNMFYACQAASEQRNDVWYLDSGCSNHMTGDQSIFVNMNTFSNSQVRMRNGVLVQAKGKEYGYSIHFEENSCKIYDKGGSSQIVTKVKMEKNRNFPLIFRYSKNVALKMDVIDESWIWHRRYGHLNFQSLKTLQQQNMVYGLPVIQEVKEACEGCALGKHHRESVLDLRDAPIEKLPNEIGNLFHLRYLSLRRTNIKKLPKSIRKLQNLMTLDLKNTNVRELPSELFKLQQLRYLLIYKSGLISEPPILKYLGFYGQVGIGSLVNLQELFFIDVNQGGVVVKELGRLSKLRRVGILGLRREDGPELCSSIEKMRNLRWLSVESLEEKVLDVQYLFSPSPLLQRVELIGKLEKFPNWISLLHNLKRIHLVGCTSREDPLEVLQALLNLTDLKLDGAYDGDELCFKTGGFQSFRH
ncbi:hypothetical protein HHK36_020284 [Tetracentron sinense]|uniref:GAG-pre-integrase domain-containing protein n=1 Tax=Tetracentron sinense TaxID=13715 RepID=A0A834YRE7_TETSI|nr:hypothetical protein HHK36_020284 [Tetracentron sinense]